MKLFEQMRREYEDGAPGRLEGCGSSASHRRMVREANRQAPEPLRKRYPQRRSRSKRALNIAAPPATNGTHGRHADHSTQVHQLR